MLTNCTSELTNETLNSRVIKALFLGVIFVAALALNVKTFLVLFKRKRHHRNVVTIFLLNLTLVSALMMSQVPFNIHAIIEQGWIFGNGFCQFNGFSNVFLCMNLIFTLLCLTIDRYLAVVRPLRHRSIMTRHTAYKMLVVVYILSFLLAVIPILGKARYMYHPGTNHCSPAWANSCGYAVAMTTIAFVLPILGMLITYTRIFLTLRHKRVLLNKSSTLTVSSKDMPDEDSNSLGNFEDTSTDPSDDCGVRLTAHNILIHPQDGAVGCDLEISATLESFVNKDLTIHHVEDETTCKNTEKSKEHLVKVGDGFPSSSDNLEEDLTIKRTRDKPMSRKISKKNIGKPTHNGLMITWSSNEHLPNEDFTANDIKHERKTAIADNSVTMIGDKKDASIMDEASTAHFTCNNLIRTHEKSSGQQDPKKFNHDVAGTRLLKLTVDDPANNFCLTLEDKELVRKNMNRIDETEVSHSESSAPKSKGKVATTEKITSDATTSSQQESDVFAKQSRVAENKQVSFQNSLKVIPCKSKDQKEEKRRLSSIFPVTRKAVNVLMRRMKRERAIRHEYKIARTGTILVVSFLILWMPYVIAHLCFVGDCRTMTFYGIATFLVYTNALANPIIYALTNRAVMQDIRNSMGRLCRSR